MKPEKIYMQNRGNSYISLYVVTEAQIGFHLPEFQKYKHS